MIEAEQAGVILGEMVEIGRAFRTAGRRSRERGLTGTKFSVLQQLRESDTRLTGLAERLELSAPVTSRAVQALECEKLAERNPDPDDARAVRISITEAGLAYLTARERAAVTAFTEHLGEWSPDEAARTIETLRTLRGKLTRAFDDLDTAALRAGDRAGARG
ncbi:MarR family winged helix-turn-helix transcriptional regulator [Tomitella fengzijianii]|uniref:MarR family transcriptional regulator n=1 Tax=Tomitella fengzijianii TaxID=2597660 RepID=A0A516X807_9ACTN|nr:MarR family transcriptional regulator [Tomitella fengzijianii]QDQ98771.1 MarR family transcriptional regulator [Tomitella fengzijianii]